MKKELLLSLLIIISSNNLFSQAVLQENTNHDQKRTENFHPNPNSNEKFGGGWFNYGKEIESLSSDFTKSAAVLHPDSTMVDGYIDSNGDTIYYNVWHHSEGQMLDPTSLNFSNTGDAEFFEVGDGFILDTVEFIYGYYRPQTQNPDQLIVQIYTTNGGGIAPNNPQSWGDLYPVSYDYQAQRGMNAVQTIEYDLTDSDVTPDTAWGAQSFALDPAIQMPTGGLVAVTYTFIPGNIFNPGDTLYSSEIQSNVSNPRNSFLVSYSRDAQPLLDPGKQNYNLGVPSDVQYNASSNGWNGSYVPGNVWSNSNGDVDYQQNIWFHLTPMAAPPSSTTNISLNNMKLYPNPAQEKINLAMNNSDNIKSVKITDVTGRTVYTQKINNNTNLIELNTSKYTPGIYFFEINGSGITETLKFTKIK